MTPLWAVRGGNYCRPARCQRLSAGRQKTDSVVNIRPMKKFITLLFLLQGFCAIARSECDSVRIYFRQGHSVLEPGLHGNREALKRIADSLRTYAGPTGRLRRIEVTGGASPEGSVLLNKRLSEKRAKALLEHLSREGGIPDSLLSFTFLGRDWGGLIPAGTQCWNSCTTSPNGAAAAKRPGTPMPPVWRISKRANPTATCTGNFSPSSGPRSSACATRQLPSGSSRSRPAFRSRSPCCEPRHPSPRPFPRPLSPDTRPGPEGRSTWRSKPTCFTMQLQCQT